MRRYWASGQIALRQFTVSQLLCSTWVPSKIFSIIFPMACNYLQALFCALVEKCFRNAENVWKHFIEGQLCFLSHKTSLMIYWWTIHNGNPLSPIHQRFSKFCSFLHFWSATCYIHDIIHVTIYCLSSRQLCRCNRQLEFHLQIFSVFHLVCTTCQKNSLLYSRSLIVSYILAGKQSSLREPVKKQGSFPPQRKIAENLQKGLKLAFFGQK